MTNDRIKELALANGFKLKDQGMGGMDLNPYVYDFAHALLAEQAAEQKSWQPLTGKMLEQFEEDGSGVCLLKDTAGYKSIGEYEWQQGRYPHGFIVNDRWVDARCIIEVMINP